MQLQCTITGIEEMEAYAEDFPNVIFRALQKTGEQLRTFALHAITDKYNVPYALIKDAIKVIPKPSDLAVSLQMHSSRLPLAMFNPKFSRGKRSADATIYVQIKKGGKTAIAGAFVTGVQTGHAGSSHFGIFERRSAFGARWSKSRPMPKKAGFKSQPGLPIKELYTISPSEMFVSTSIFNQLQDFFNQKFPEVLDHEMQFEGTRN